MADFAQKFPTETPLEVLGTASGDARYLKLSGGTMTGSEILASIDMALSGILPNTVGSASQLIHLTNNKSLGGGEGASQAMYIDIPVDNTGGWGLHAGAYGTNNFVFAAGVHGTNGVGYALKCDTDGYGILGFYNTGDSFTGKWLSFRNIDTGVPWFEINSDGSLSTDLSMKKTSAQGYISAWDTAGTDYIYMYHDGDNGNILTNSGSLLLGANSGMIFTQHTYPGTDNTYDLGYDAANYRWRNLFLSGNASVASSVTATSFVIGGNTLNTTEWAYLDGQNQALKTTDSPIFATVNATTALQVNGVSLASTTPSSEGAKLIGTDTKTNLNNATEVETALTYLDANLNTAATYYNDFVLWGERSAPTTSLRFSLGNGQGTYGFTAMADGEIVSISSVCSGSTGTLCPIFVTINGSQTAATCPTSTTQYQGTTREAPGDFTAPTFSKGDVIGLQAGTVTGTWGATVVACTLRYTSTIAGLKGDTGATGAAGADGDVTFLEDPTTDNRLVRVNGTGADSIQQCAITCDDTGNLYPVSDETISIGDASHKVLQAYIKNIFSSAVVNGTGSASNPSYTFSGDTNTGIYSSTGDNVSIACGGSQKLSFGTSSNINYNPLTVDVGTADNKISILGATSSDVGDFFYFQGTNDSMGGWSSGNVSTETGVSARYIIRVHLKTSTVDWDGSMYVRDPPPFAPSPDTPAGGNCDFEIDTSNIIVHKHMIGDTDKVDFYAVQAVIKYRNMDTEARKRFGLRTTKGEGDNETSLTAQEIASYDETFTMLFAPDKWNDATAKDMIMKEFNDRVEWRRNKLAGIKVKVIDPKTIGFTTTVTP